jgi:transposase
LPPNRCEYGTILVDLEQHRVLDLLPDRTAATMTAWLSRHPEVEIQPELILQLGRPAQST